MNWTETFKGPFKVSHKHRKVSSVGACSHCAICGYNLFFPTMGYMGDSEVVAVAKSEQFHWVLYNPLDRSRKPGLNGKPGLNPWLDP